MERWEVFGRRKIDDPWTAAGAVHAPDRELALMLAKESFFRHGEGVDFAVVRLADIHRCPDPSILEPATDKSYRYQSGYPLGAKRRRALDHVAALGARVDKPRPVDLREHNPEHREAS